MTRQVSLIPGACNKHNGSDRGHPAGALSCYSARKAALLEKLQSDKGSEKQNGQRNITENNAGLVRSNDTLREHLTHSD